MKNHFRIQLNSYTRKLLSRIFGMISIASFITSFLFFTGITGSVVGLSRDNIYALISLAVGLFSGMFWSALQKR